ncbi:MAG: phospho-sugar mutase [Clostridia bacterium]|nr:phospho-sugar mutase [Clostridia bacterium]
MGYMEEYKRWCEDSYFDEATKSELLSIKDDPKEIEERFYKNLEFGTGGLRGILGAGTNRMNIYTVSKATQGFANYIKKQGEEAVKKGVAIAYDSRNYSPEFAEVTARVLAGNGIKAYLSDELRPVPMLSFAVRNLGCTGGIVITASHNPPEYNGYKVYWEDGAQVPYPRDGEIIKEVNAITDFKMIKMADLTEAVNSSLIQYVGPELDVHYLDAVTAQIVNQKIIDETDLKIVYTPIHGSGNKPVRRALAKAGFKNVYVVPQQEKPDGNFTTVGYPNPENKAVFDLAMELAKKVDADIIVGTDPDADRLGAVVKKTDGDYMVLTGNMTGALLCEYILSQKKAAGTLPANGAVVSTIVSTDMTKAICKEYGMTYFDVLTGFKYIGEKIKNFEADNSYEYMFGFEESYGCLAGTYARDKDGCLATMLVCELAAFYKSKGMSLYDGLIALYEKYGYYKEDITSITLKGIDGAAQIKKVMDTLRADALTEVAGVKVIEARDYSIDKIVNMVTGEESVSGLPSSNVLYYILEDGTWFCVRPSGTEPKIKVYFGAKDTTEEKANAKVKAASDGILAIVDSILK